jgi:type VI protein secretion system component Hcp
VDRDSGLGLGSRSGIELDQGRRRERRQAQPRKGSPETYFTMSMEGAFITKVSNSGTEEGNVVQKVELVFKTVKIEYKPQDNKTGALLATKTYNWDIPAGTASPSA